MLGLRQILMSAYAGLFCLGLVCAAEAKPLEVSERIVCSDLRQCIDIIRRHDAQEFDYAVLEAEFARFGPKGRQSLFDILESKAGNADISRMILALGPLTPAELIRVDRIWAGPQARQVIPFLETQTGRNRDRWIAGLSHPDPQVRIFSRRLYSMDKSLMALPMTRSQRAAILADMRAYPRPQHQALLSRFPSVGYEAALSEIMLNGADAAVAGAAYTALYRESPAKAFQRLLDTSQQARTGKQVAQLGQMIADRHQNRADGFYAKFAADLSEDNTMPVHVRAVGLHAWFLSMGNSSSEQPRSNLSFAFNPPRLEALDFLIKTDQMTTDYALVMDQLSAAQSEVALKKLWIGGARNTPEIRGLLLKSALGTSLEETALTQALSSNEPAFTLKAITFASMMPKHKAKIQPLVNHPIAKIRAAAQQAVRTGSVDFKAPSFRAAFQKALKNQTQCRINSFDRADIMNQMPYFDEAPVKVDQDDPWLRGISRRSLIAAHPTPDGWLAGYAYAARSGFLFFNNKTGEGRVVAEFAYPYAILPDRILPLGQSTRRFWVIDAEGQGGSRSVLYRLIQTPDGFQKTRIAALPARPTDAALASNGDILVSFENGRLDTQRMQAPLRYSQTGRLSSACPPKAGIHVPVSLN